MSPEATPGLAELALRAGLALAAVLALIGGLAFLVRRARIGARPGAARAHLVPLDRVDFGGRRELRLVRVRDRLVLVGVTGERISLLTELPVGPDEAEEPKGLQLLQKLANSP